MPTSSREDFVNGLLRAFIVEYFRVASTEVGHESAGHGGLPPDFGQSEGVVSTLVSGSGCSCSNPAKP